MNKNVVVHDGHFIIYKWCHVWIVINLVLYSSSHPKGRVCGTRYECSDNNCSNNDRSKFLRLLTNFLEWKHNNLAAS